MEIIYRADDGTEFYSEKECCEYEENWNRVPKSIRFYKNGELLVYGVDGDMDDLYNECDEVEILPIDGWERDLKFMHEWHGFLDSIHEPGIYDYSDYSYEWVKVEGEEKK